MKKSTIVVLIGGFILLTAFLGPMSHEKMYQKQKNFNSVDELVQVLNTKPLFTLKNNSSGKIVETDDFKECLSVRKRLTDSDMNKAKIDVEEIIDLDEKTKNDLLDYYDKLREKNSKRLSIAKKEAVRLKIQSYYISDYRTGELEPSKYNNAYEVMDLILVDEGEGYVIDFVNNFDSNHIPDYSKIDVDAGDYMGQGEHVKSHEESTQIEDTYDKEVENNA